MKRFIGLELGEELLTFAFLVLLALAWIVIFLPAVVRAREMAPLSAAERFKRRMQLIAPKASDEGRWVLVPESSEHLVRASFRRGQRRRRRIFAFLVASVPVSAMAAAFVEAALWPAHLALDASLVLYVVLLIDAKRRREERSQKVRSIRSPRMQRAGAGIFKTAEAARARR